MKLNYLTELRDPGAVKSTHLLGGAWSGHLRCGGLLKTVKVTPSFPSPLSVSEYGQGHITLGLSMFE